MPVSSVSQKINVQYGSSVTSESVNEKARDIFGERGKISGLDLAPLSGLNCALSPGKFMVKGVTIEEPAQLTIPIPANSSGSTKNYYIYGIYTHGDGATCEYHVLDATTASADAVLLSTVALPNAAATVLVGHITNELGSAKSKDAVVFSDRKGKKMEAVNEITIGTAKFTAGNVAVSGTSYVSADCYFKATRSYNPYLTDYAEWFERKPNERTEPGDIVSLDEASPRELYRRARLDDKCVAGIQSDEYAHIIGGDDVPDEENIKNFIPIALAGRVHVKVDGIVRKGHYIGASEVPGVGMSMGMIFNPARAHTYVGRACEDKLSGNIGLVRCQVIKY